MSLSTGHEMIQMWWALASHYLSNSISSSAINALVEHPRQSRSCGNGNLSVCQFIRIVITLCKHETLDVTNHLVVLTEEYSSVFIGAAFVTEARTHASLELSWASDVILIASAKGVAQCGIEPAKRPKWPELCQARCASKQLLASPRSFREACVSRRVEYALSTLLELPPEETAHEKARKSSDAQGNLELRSQSGSLVCPIDCLVTVERYHRHRRLVCPKIQCVSQGDETLRKGLPSCHLRQRAGQADRID